MYSCDPYCDFSGRGKASVLQRPESIQCLGQNTLERTTSGYLASEVLRRSATRWQCGPSSQGRIRSRGAVRDWRGNKKMAKVTRKA